AELFDRQLRIEFLYHELDLARDPCLRPGRADDPAWREPPMHELEAGALELRGGHVGSGDHRHGTVIAPAGALLNVFDDADDDADVRLAADRIAIRRVLPDERLVDDR